MIWRRRIVLLVGIAIVVGIPVAIATHKSHPDPTASNRSDPRRSYSVGEVTCTFVDGSRPTHNYVTGAVTPGRVLRTEIRYPSPATSGPFPTIVFAHGYSVTPDTYSVLLDEWVRAGFVVVAPIFPDTNETAVDATKGRSDPEQDVVNQPADMAFVVRRVIAESRVRSASCPRLFKLVRPAEIGLAGQSDGGDTVAMLAYDSRYDSHPGVTFRAVAVLSGSEWSFPPSGADPYVGHPSSPPLLITQSETDGCNPPQYAVKLYDDVANGHEWFLRVFNALHLAPYDGHDAAAFAIIARTTTRFFQLELAGQGSSARLRSVGNSEPAVAQISNGAAPVIPSVTQSPSACYAS